MKTEIPTQQTTGAIQQLIAFANRRAGIDPHNYNNASSYRSESRSVTKDLKDFRTVLAEAIALGIPDSLVVEVAPHSYSGRLDWNGKDWDYCTGQYFPTEYRKAARVVLEHAISAFKRAHAEEVVKPHFGTVADVRAYHEQTGSHWFERSTMRFFGTKIHTRGILICGKYFITSEQPPHGPRGYTVREVSDEGAIKTIGELCEHGTAKQAERAARLRG